MSEDEQGHHHRWLILFVVLGGQFLLAGSMGMANIAVPAIRLDMAAGDGAAQLIIVLYQLSFAVMLLVGGRMGDIFGPKPVFLYSLGGFVGATLLAALAPTIWVLLLARLLQGLFGGLAGPQVVAVIQVIFPLTERPRAIGYFATVMGVGFVAAQVGTGFVIDLDLFGLSWRAAFLLTVPIGMLVLIASARLMPHHVDATRLRLDVGGVLLSGGAVFLFVLPLVASGGRSIPIWGYVSAVASAVLAFTLVRHQRSRAAAGKSTAYVMSLVADRRFRSGLWVSVVTHSALFAIVFVLTITLQSGLGFTALASAVALAPIPVGFITGSMLAPRFMRSLGRYTIGLCASTLVVATVILLVMVAMSAESIALLQIAPVLFMFGFAQGVVVPTLVAVLLEHVQASDAGFASGLMQTVQNVGGALGLAFFGAVFFGVLGDNEDTASYLGAFEATLWMSFVVYGGIFAMQFVLDRDALRSMVRGNPAGVIAPSAAFGVDGSVEGGTVMTNRRS